MRSASKCCGQEAGCTCVQFDLPPGGSSLTGAMDFKTNYYWGYGMQTSCFDKEAEEK